MFTELLDIAIVALGAPLVVRIAPRLRIPSIVVEIVGGIIIGPQVLNVVRADVHVQLMSQIGLAFLLFLAGLEVNVQALRGPLARLAAEAFLARSRPSSANSCSSPARWPSSGRSSCCPFSSRGSPRAREAPSSCSAGSAS